MLAIPNPSDGMTNSKFAPGEYNPTSEAFTSGLIGLEMERIAEYFVGIKLFALGGAVLVNAEF